MAKKETDAVKESVPETAEQAETVTAPASTPAGQAVQMVMQPKEPDVKILCIHSAYHGNQFPIGKGRIIQRSGAMFTVNKEYFEGEFQTPFVEKMLRDRVFIVLSGLTDEEREQYGVLYKPGEIIKSGGMFDFFFDKSTAEAARIFADLCPEHQAMVAQRFVNVVAGEDTKRRSRVTRERVEALSAVAHDKNLFLPIRKTFNV